jgi:hypothetical protein
MPDRALALELDRALAGEDAVDEARELAALLVAAAAPARFDVAADEVEAAFGHVRPVRRASRRPRLALAFAVALVLAALAALVLRAPSEDVEAKAADALEHTYYVSERVRPARPGLFQPTDVTGIADPRRGLGHWTVSSGGGVDVETRVEGDQVMRYDAASNTLTLADSCRAFASGCADVLDPVELYRRTLGSGNGAVRKRGDDWRLTLRGAHVDQIVTIDGKTYLPTRIEWRDDGRLVSTVEIVTIDRHIRASIDDFALQPHPGARVRHLTATGAPVKREGATIVRTPRGALWLGRSWQGFPPHAEQVQFNAGRALRIAYGPVAVWNYSTFVPPEVAAARVGFAKVIPLSGGGVARIYFSERGAVVADVERGGRRAAVVTSARGKIDVFRAAEALRTAP